MQRILLIMLTVLCMLTFTSCDAENEKNVSTVVDESAVQTEMIPTNTSAYTDENGNHVEVTITGSPPALPTFEDVKDAYPDKTVLVWAAQYMSTVPVNEINKYLDDKGYDFAVCFKSFADDATESALFPDACAENIKERLDSGEQIDIISPMNYKDYIFGGMYEPLDNYFETDLGKKLYSIMPAGHWESLRVKGSIYGVHGPDGYTLTPDWGYFVNAELAEKYGFDVSKSIDDQIDILKKVKKNEVGCDVFSMSLSRTQIPILNVGTKEISFSVSSVYWNNETHSAKCAFDNVGYLEKLRLYDALTSEGLFKDARTSPSNNFFILQENIGGAGVVYKTSDRVTVNYSDNEIEAIPVYNEPTYIRQCGVATGICSYSDNKEKAFELLALTQTDAYLNNLLAFGVEGGNYELENAAIKEVSPYYAFNEIYFANNMICLPHGELWFTPEQYKKIYANAKTFGDSGFVVDLEPIAVELNAAEPVMDDLKFREEKDGVELSLQVTISALRERLENAGIQKIIDECNRQYGEYKNEKN